MRLAALLAATLCACASSGRPRDLPLFDLEWLPGHGTFEARTAGFEVPVPAGWERAFREEDQLVVTRDGPSLQQIVVGSSAAGEPLGPWNGRRPVAAGMASAELAELFVEGAREAVLEVSVVDRGAAALAGREAVWVVVAYRDSEGLRRRAAFCGVVEGGRAVHVAYHAPERRYFARDLPVFEEVVRGVRLRPAGPRGR
jgi:hypothetical protein